MNRNYLLSLKLESEFLESHPECDNVQAFFPITESSLLVYYISRYGNLVFNISKKDKRIKIVSLQRSKSFKNYTRKAYDNYLFFKKRVLYNNRYVINDLIMHRCVATMFVDKNSLFATEVDHNDGNKFNNNADNLEWVTPDENRRRRWIAYYKQKGNSVPEFLQSEESYNKYLEVYYKKL